MCCRYLTEGLGLSSPVTDGSTAYMSDTIAYVYALDLVTGEAALPHAAAAARRASQRISAQ